MANKPQKFGFAKLDTNENLLGLKPWSGTLPPPPDGIQGGKSRPNQISPTTRVAGKKHTRHTSRTDLCARGEKHAAYITHGAVCTWGKTCHTVQTG